MPVRRALAPAWPGGAHGAAPTAGPLPQPVKRWSGFQSPVGMAFDRAGVLHVAEWSAGRITRIDPSGRRSVLASGLAGPSGLAIDADGAIYVASYAASEVWRFTPEGRQSTYVTGLATPAGLGFDRQGRLMIANRRTHQILVVNQGGKPEVLIDRLNTPVGAVQTADGGYVVSNIAGGVSIVRPDGRRLEAGRALRSPAPGITINAAGRVFVADYGGTTVHEILPHGASRPVADGLPSPAGLVAAPGGATLFAATWGDGALYEIRIPA